MVRALAVAFLLAIVPASSLAANELTVDRREVRLNDLVTITVSLEGAFASVDMLAVPVTNLSIVSEPWVSSEFSWINGNVVRRKVFRYRARPQQAGAARVGPLSLDGDDGQRMTLPAIDVTVTSDPASMSNDAASILRELVSSGREPLFVIAESSAQNVYVGEPFEVTWWLYNAAAVQQWQVSSIPRLDEFWTEERPKSETPERVPVGDSLLQRTPIRRAVLFPLRSGALRIPGLSVEAAVMRRSRSGPFGMFEGELIETSFTSAPVEIIAKPLPPGLPVDLVGDVTLACSPPAQSNDGPVVINVTLQGVGNLRAAKEPRFDGAVAGRLQIEGGELTVTPPAGEFAMRRQWRYLLFPASSGTMTIPALTMTVFNPARGARQELVCTGSYFDAQVAEVAPLPAAASEASERRATSVLPIVAGLVIAIAAALLAWVWGRRELALRRAVRDVMREGNAEVMTRIRARISFDEREAGERGDALRALRSLVEAVTQGRDAGDNADREIARRVRDVLRS